MSSSKKAAPGLLPEVAASLIVISVPISFSANPFNTACFLIGMRTGKDYSANN